MNTQEEMSLQPIPQSTGDFPKIRTEGCLYVDKTAYFHRMIMTKGCESVFLARPRRFGKSLMITTLKAIFQGRRELFKGLAIDSLDYDWKVYPVIHLNLGFCAAAQYEDFAASLPNTMGQALREAGYEYDDKVSPGDNFGNALDCFWEKKTPCVLLIDEYDDPVAKALAHVDEAEKVRNALSRVYGQLKDRTGKIRFLMITGVSKFTKMSIFSTISNLVDLSFDDNYAMMLGYTEAELDANFAPHMAAHAVKMGLSLDAYRAELKRLYNGYRFWLEQGEKVYNPVSVNLTLARRESHFRYYWTDTGRPSMLMNVLKRGDILSLDPENVAEVSDSDFDVTDLGNLHAIAMLYQTGYLTIRDYDPFFKSFTLGVPDEEVRQDLAKLMTSQRAGKDVAWAQRLGLYLLKAKWDLFFDGLAALYAGAPYGSTEGRVHEISFTRCLTFLLQGQGIICHPEVTQADGRVDLVAEHYCGIYIFELKVDRPAALAMSQIERRDYAAPYRATQKTIYCIGLSFDSKTRHLIDHVVEPLATMTEEAQSTAGDLKIGQVDLKIGQGVLQKCQGDEGK